MYTSLQIRLPSPHQDDTSGDYKEMLLALIGVREVTAPTEEEIAEANEEQELEEVEEEVIEVSLRNRSIIDIRYDILLFQ